MIQQMHMRAFQFDRVKGLKECFVRGAEWEGRETSESLEWSN